MHTLKSGNRSSRERGIERRLNGVLRSWVNVKDDQSGLVVYKERNRGHNETITCSCLISRVISLEQARNSGSGHNTQLLPHVLLSIKAKRRLYITSHSALTFH